MSANEKTDANAELAQILESAQRLGVELDEAEALRWLTAIAAGKEGNEVVLDMESGAFGHHVSMLDFSSVQLERFRRIGRIVEITDTPGVVESALSISGSAAQSKIQSYPGDCDFFERVNITVPTRAEACTILSKLMRDKALNTERGADYQFIEVKYGSYQFDCARDGVGRKKGSPVSWSIGPLRAGQFDVTTADGKVTTLHWDDFTMEPGWCKLDWVVSDPERRTLANASNVLDVTWEAPDGSITPLDGYLDSYFQEVYLDAASIPIFSKVAKHVSQDVLGDYVKQLEHEVYKYVVEHPNYGKAAKRMYNVFRLTGRYTDAAFIRELFDEPATMLYQVWSLLGTVENAMSPDSSIPLDDVVAQTDELIVMVVKALEGDEETEIVRSLLRLRGGLTSAMVSDVRTNEIEAARAQIVNVINNFFQERLTALPSVNGYLEEIRART
ncbi:MAG: hypothetical protein ABI670_04635 [Chloroflexota bacterium]